MEDDSATAVARGRARVRPAPPSGGPGRGQSPRSSPREGSSSSMTAGGRGTSTRASVSPRATGGGGRGRGAPLARPLSSSSDDESDSDKPLPAVDSVIESRPGAGRGRGAPLIPQSSSDSDDDLPLPEVRSLIEDSRPAVSSGRGRAPASSGAVSSGRGRGKLPLPVESTESSSDDDMPLPQVASVIEQQPSAGRGVSPRPAPPPSSGRGRGVPIQPASPSSDDEFDAIVGGAAAPAVVVVSSGRGRAPAPATAPTVPLSIDVDASSSDESDASGADTVVTGSAAALVVGRGRGRNSGESAAGVIVSGRGRGAAVLPMKIDVSSSEDDDASLSESASAGPSPRIASGRGRGSRGSSSPRPTSLGRGRGAQVELELESEDDPASPPIPGRGRGARSPRDVSPRVSPRGSRASAGAGRGSLTAPTRSPRTGTDEAAPLSPRGRGAGGGPRLSLKVPSQSPEGEDDEDEDGDSASSAAASPRRPSPRRASPRTNVLSPRRAPPPEGVAVVMTEEQKRQMLVLLEEKEKKIQTMEDLERDLMADPDELNKAMQLASYLDREKEAEEEEAAPVVQPKAVPFVSKILSAEVTVRDAGHPTCLAVRKPWIAIGMTHGVVLVFDKDQKLSGICGTHEGSEYGRVSALAISNSAKMLLVGHGSGAVVLWDINEIKRPIKVITDSHRGPVIHAGFLKDDNSWVTADTEGRMVSSALTYFLVYIHTATEIIRDHGPVLALRSLVPGTSRDGTDGMGLCAACTASGGLMIFSVYPKIIVWRTVPRPERVPPSCMPYVSWREAVNVSSGTDMIGDPILALAWGSEILLFRMVTRGPGGDVKVVDMGSYTLPNSEVTAVTWLGYNAITILTTRNEMKVLDPFSLTVLETSSVDNMDVASHKLFGDDYPTGCYSNSVTNQGDSGFLLGVTELYALRVLSWNDRVRSMVENEQWLLALATCYETYLLKGKGFLGISADPQRVKAVASKKTEEILSAMLTRILHNEESSLHERRVLASVCIRYCQLLQKEQLLFNVIFPMFRKAGGSNEAIFLELLEPNILQDRLQSMNNETMDAFVQHYYSSGHIQRLEQCLLHLDIKTLDFDHVVLLCRQYKLASALIYIYNTGRDDYMTPLDILFDGVDLESGHIAKRATGLRILLYISKALQGQRFPSGSIPRHRVTPVKYDILQSLFDESLKKVLALIHFDPEEFFKCLRVFMEDSSLVEMRPTYIKKLETLLIDPSVRPWKPFREQKSSYPFKTVELTHFWIFLAESLSSIEISDAVFERMMSDLLLDDDPDTRAGRQRALLQIIKVAKPERYDEQKVLMLAQGAEMYELAEVFYMKQRNYRKVVQYAIESSKHDKKHVFDLINTLMNDPLLTDQDRDMVKKSAMASLEQLIEANAEAASMMIMEHFAGTDYAKTVHELDSHPQLQYRLLRGVVDHHVTGEGGAKWEQILQDFHMGQELTETYVRLLCEYDPPGVYPYLMKAEDYDFNRCLELVKRYGIEDAVMFLLERTGDLKGAMSSILKALESRIAEMKKAYAKLTEVGDGGLNMPEEKSVLEMLNVAVGLCQRNSNKDQKDARINSQLWFMVLDRVMAPTTAAAAAEVAAQDEPGASARGRKMTTALRAGDKLPPGGEGDSKRMSLLALPIPARKLKITFNFLMREVLRHMMSYVPLPTILDKIVREHARSEFAEFKDVIYSMLETFHYEGSILGLANHVLQNDIFEASALFRKRRIRPFKPQDPFCSACHEGLADRPSGVLMYVCGHAFHRSCVDKVDHCSLCVISAAKKKPARPGGPKSKGGGDDDEGADGDSQGRGRGQTMQEKAETASLNDEQARMQSVVERYRVYLRNHGAETPKFLMLQLFDQGVTDIYQHVGGLQLAPKIVIEKKIRAREPGSLPTVAKYRFELTAAEAKKLRSESSKKSRPKSSKQGGGKK